MEEAMEYRNETYKNTSKVYNIEDGYKVVYPYGHTSFSPKDVFESAYFQLGDEKGERITSEDVDNFVKDTFSAKVGSKTTNTTLVLLNDFEVHGQASCVKAENYNIEIGKKFAVEKLRIKFGKFLVLYCNGELMVLKRNK